MRPRQDRERGDPLGVAIGERPGDAAAPIMAGQMKAPVGIATGRDDRHRIVHQAVDVIARKIVRVGPRARRIAALARRDGAIAHVGQRSDLRAPAMHRFRKAVQQQHQRRSLVARGQRVEGEVRGDGDLGEGGHATSFNRNHSDENKARTGGDSRLFSLPGREAMAESVVTILALANDIRCTSIVASEQPPSSAAGMRGARQS